MALVTSRKSKLKPGEEITINYGDKGNEELFMQYGETMSDCSKKFRTTEQNPVVTPISGQEERHINLSLPIQAQPWLLLTDI